MIYQIRDWDSHFENFKSRTVNKCGYVCVPNKQSGMGFTRILHEKDGMAIYGVWQCLVGACSKQHIPRKGWFTDDGTPAGMAWTTEDLALKFHREEKEIARAMEVLCSPKVGWIILHEEKNGELLELPAVAVAVSAEPAVKTARKSPSDYPPEVEEIYQAYPKKVDRLEALKAIATALRKFPATLLLEKTRLYATARIGADHQYTPYPATWFNGERFNEDPTLWRTGMGNGKPAVVVPDHSKGF